MLLKRMSKASKIAFRDANQGARRSRSSSAIVSGSLTSGKVLQEVDCKIDEIKGHISTDVLEVSVTVGVMLSFSGLIRLPSTVLLPCLPLRKTDVSNRSSTP